MQFVSQGGALITGNLNLARRRMFLMTSDVARPTTTDTVDTIMAKIHKARSFSHSKQDNGTLNCTRSAGWAGNQYYHTLVGPMRYDWSDEGVSSGVTYLDMSSTVMTNLRAFARMYSIGATPVPSLGFAADTGTLHDTLTDKYEDVSTALVIRFPTMILPHFEGTVTDGQVFDTTDEAVTNITASSGNIGTVGQYENRSARYIQTWYQTANNAGQITYSGNAAALNNVSAGQEFVVSSQVAANATAARLVFGNSWSMAGSRYYSGGGWNYSYARGKLLQLNKSTEARRYYSKGTGQTNTVNYGFDWAVMPVLLPDNSVILQIADFASDLTQTGQASVATVPQIVSNISDLSNKQSLISL